MSYNGSWDYGKGKGGAYPPAPGYGGKDGYGGKATSEGQIRGRGGLEAGWHHGVGGTWSPVYQRRLGRSSGAQVGMMDCRPGPRRTPVTQEISWNTSICINNYIVM